MKKLFAFIAAFLLINAKGLSQEYIITLESYGVKSGVIELTIKDNKATSTMNGVKEEFDLKNMKWKDQNSEKWISIEDCKKWTEQSKNKTLQNISKQKLPDNIKAFIEWSLDPKFNESKENFKLSLISGKVDYVIEGKLSDKGASEYYKYAILNAYKKAMTQGKLPPFSELKAIESMIKLEYIPEKISVNIPVIPQAPKITLKINKKI